MSILSGHFAMRNQKREGKGRIDDLIARNDDDGGGDDDDDDEADDDDDDGGDDDDEEEDEEEDDDDGWKISSFTVLYKNLAIGKGSALARPLIATSLMYFKVKYNYNSVILYE